MTRLTVLAVLLTVTLVRMTTAAVRGDAEVEVQGILREPLRGLTSVYVVVEDVSPEIERAGLTASQLETDAEHRLRKAGIRVLPSAEGLLVGSAYLHIAVLGHKVAPPRSQVLGYAACINVSLRQTVQLERDPAITVYGAETWKARRLQMGPPTGVKSIRQAVSTFVDDFINAYRAVNPPQGR